jgi:hypothetical protein
VHEYQPDQAHEYSCHVNGTDLTHWDEQPILKSSVAEGVADALVDPVHHVVDEDMERRWPATDRWSEEGHVAEIWSIG